LLNLGLDIWEAISVYFIFYVSLMSFIREMGTASTVASGTGHQDLSTRREEPETGECMGQ
jgi:hypothetical protein